MLETALAQPQVAEDGWIELLPAKKASEYRQPPTREVIPVPGTTTQENLSSGTSTTAAPTNGGTKKGDVTVAGRGQGGGNNPQGPFGSNPA